MIHTGWTFEAIKRVHERPFFELLSQAHAVHKENHDLCEVQVCTLISIKTGGCSEDCKYCSQSARYQTGIQATPLMEYEEVLRRAKIAIARGASRICLGAAWRQLRENSQFNEILKMVSGICALGAEVCCTLGMLTFEQIEKLKEAGLYAYNHNLDSSENFYKTIITTRSYQERLATLDLVEKAGVSVCCGAILGMGEEIDDRLEFLHTLSLRTPHPESVPLNKLTAVPGTPLENQPKLAIWEHLRMIATTRIVLPKATIRLSAGRDTMTKEQHALAFFAGANSIHGGGIHLTAVVPTATVDFDDEMFTLFQLKKRPAYAYTA